MPCDIEIETNVHVLSICSCMVDSKVAYQSKFLTSSSKMSQKFTVGSMVFKDKPISSSKTQVQHRSNAIDLHYCM